eukprot:422609_1
MTSLINRYSCIIFFFEMYVLDNIAVSGNSFDSDSICVPCLDQTVKQESIHGGPKVAVSKFAEGFNDDQGQCGVVIWDETLTLVSTVYRIGGTDSYKRKQSKISIKKSSGKTIGKIRFDIAKFVDDEEGDAKNIQFVLEKCKDPDARLSVSLRCRSVAGNSDDMPSLASMPSMGSMESLDSYDSPPSQSQNSRQASVSRKYSGSRKYSDSRGQNKPNSTAPTFSRAGSHNNRPDSGGSYEQKTPDIGRLPRPTSFKSDDIGGSGRRPPPDADQSDEGAALRAYYEKRVAE